MTLLAARTAPRLARLGRSAAAGAARRAAATAVSTAPPPAVAGGAAESSGLLDDAGLLRFATLHELNAGAASAFRDRELFGTYRETVVEENVVAPAPPKEEAAAGRFEWMTYGEYGAMVARCRTVLKDIGASSLARRLFWF